MFVTDTVDAVYRPDEWTPESLMDRLAEVVGDLPDTRVRTDLISTIPGPDRVHKLNTDRSADCHFPFPCTTRLSQSPSHTRLFPLSLPLVAFTAPTAQWREVNREHQGPRTFLFACELILV